jgi:hypothetical protein
MKTQNKKDNFKYVLSILGLTVLIFAISGIVPAVHAQSQELVQPPLSPDLSWNSLGATNRSIVVNGNTISMDGDEFQAEEHFNLEQREEIQDYYSTGNLSSLGWGLVSTTPRIDGVTSLYYHSDGYFVSVEFNACDKNISLSCLSVWKSEQTTIVPDSKSSADDGMGIQALASFDKTSPANGATTDVTGVTLSWSAYSGSNFNRYRYCIDSSNNKTCDDAQGWTSVWSGTSVAVTRTFTGGTTYYWQVQAVLNDDTKVDANSGTWWSFVAKLTSPPGAFGKSLPTSGSTNQSATPTLVWKTSANAASYAYCIDTTNNNICDTNWISTGTSTYTSLLFGVAPNTIYYWQVRASNANGNTLADSNSWWTFTTGPNLANDLLDTATVATIPFKGNPNTQSATIDSDTTNSCSPGLGFASVWYKYSATTNRRMYVDSFGSSYDTFIAVWIKNSNGLLNLVTCNNDDSGGKQSRVTFSVTNGTTYYIQIAQTNSNSAPSQTPGGTLQVSVKSFLDVMGNDSFWPYIEGIYKAGITSGCGTNPEIVYCPTTNVTRAQMAIFLLRAEHGGSYTPPAVGTSTGFSDVSTSYWAAAWIKQLAAEGITSGCGNGNFCPDQFVSRAQMAIFLLRGKNGSAYIPPSSGGSTGFSDVPSTYWAADWIKQLAADGITSGCGGGNYCPDSYATRGQMAVFISRAFSIPVAP